MKYSCYFPFTFNIIRYRAGNGSFVRSFVPAPSGLFAQRRETESDVQSLTLTKLGSFPSALLDSWFVLLDFSNLSLKIPLLLL